LSPVYSLAVQNQALWLLSGTESGGINVQSVRHSEGTRITTLRQHTSAVSVLNLAQDERSVLSGSWDMTINDWDLNTGQVKRTFAGRGGQISAIEPRPHSSLPIPEDNGLTGLTNGTFSSNNASKPKTNGFLSNGLLDQASQGDAGAQDAAGSPDDDMNSLFGDDDEAPSMPLADDEDDEFSRAIATGLQQQNEEDADADVDMADSGGPVLPPSEDVKVETAPAAEQSEIVMNGVASDDATAQVNGLPHAEEPTVNGVSQPDKPPTSDSTFLDASFDGTIRIWDKRQSNPIARITPPRGTPPWCMSACWSPDGNFIYAGRRNNAVDEYSFHKGLREPTRTFKFPGGSPGSGPVSAVRAMPNGKHLIW
jgi:transcriptional activator SPT8